MQRMLFKKEIILIYTFWFFIKKEIKIFFIKNKYIFKKYIKHTVLTSFNFSNYYIRIMDSRILIGTLTIKRKCKFSLEKWKINNSKCGNNPRQFWAHENCLVLSYLADHRGRVPQTAEAQHGRHARYMFSWTTWNAIHSAFVLIFVHFKNKL